MQDNAKFQKQDPKHKVSTLDRIVPVFAIIASIAQVIGAGVRIAEYINNQSESQFVHIYREKQPKTNSDKGIP